ncbi:gamma-glutamyl-gamma-aminobutyrate hydrolase family protein [Aerosakkonema funiforme]|uniref:gamma-glutamyl-gamma-aminobutyrate hydrolase family protein n=1 Tax=Aerosakkonema funiforme TaxID=1246630 RepID=UPI0035BABDF8
MKFHPPLIGITTSSQHQTASFCVRREYVDAVRLAGGLPMLLTPGEPNVATILESVDGIVFSGGGDIDPAAYNGAAHPSIYNVDAERDRFELSLAQLALETDIPILGICRGLEILVVASGGKLVTHLPDEFGETIVHRAEQARPCEHNVQITPNSRLATIIGPGEAKIVSWHHQAASTIPPDWRLTAQASDGVIEALEHQHHPWALALQWHPELSLNDERQQRIFRTFVAAAAHRNAAFSQKAG